MKVRLILMFVLTSVLAQAQTVDVIVSFTDGTPDKIFQVENMIGSIQEFAGDDLRKYYRKENLNELQIYYDLEVVSTIYAGDPERPFLVEYGDDSYESYRIDECVEWFYEKFEEYER